MSVRTESVVLVAGSTPVDLGIAQHLDHTGTQVVHVRDSEADAVPEGVHSIVHPVRNFAEAADLITKVEGNHGPLHGLVTATPPTSSASLVSLQAASWSEWRQRTIKRNVALAKAATAAMIDREGGRIVVMSSTTAFFSAGAEQAATNAAMISLSNAITLSTDAKKVASNCVIVGHGSDRGGAESAVETSAALVSSLVAFLLGKASHHINGRLLSCSGQSVGLYVLPLVIESTNAIVRFPDTPTGQELATALDPLLEIGKV